MILLLQYPIDKQCRHPGKYFSLNNPHRPYSIAQNSENTRSFSTSRGSYDREGSSSYLRDSYLRDTPEL
jgi:hypothetical protein